MQNKHKSPLSAVAVVALTLVVVGCGGMRSYEARQWRGAGFTDEEALAWDRATATTDEGETLEWSFNMRQAKRLKEAGFTPSEAVLAKYGDGIDLLTLDAYQSRGFNREQAELLDDKGISPAQADSWQDNGVEPERAVELKGMGFNYHDVRRLGRFGLTPEDAVEWGPVIEDLHMKDAAQFKRAGVSPETAELFADMGMFYSDAEPYLKTGLDHEELRAWENAGFSLSDSRSIFSWRQTGFSPQKSRRFIKSHVWPEIAADVERICGDPPNVELAREDPNGGQGGCYIVFGRVMQTFSADKALIQEIDETHSALGVVMLRFDGSAPAQGTTIATLVERAGPFEYRSTRGRQTVVSSGDVILRRNLN